MAMTRCALAFDVGLIVVCATVVEGRKTLCQKHHHNKKTLSSSYSVPSNIISRRQQFIMAATPMGSFFRGLVSSSPSAYVHPPPPLSKESLHNLHGQEVTLVGFGSLLSETSSRTTFPTLTNFRLGRIQGFRRLFRHPAAIFFERGIANIDTLEISSLSVEPVIDSKDDIGFVCSLFDVPDFNVHDYVNREEEFDFCMAEYTELGNTERKGQGLMCLASTDDRVESRWGEGYIKDKYGVHGLDSIWHGWDWEGQDGGKQILPCPVYLRHCVLASQKQGPEAYFSFIRETYLADRKTTIEEHLTRRQDIMLTEPPPSVANRYTG